MAAASLSRKGVFWTAAGVIVAGVGVIVTIVLSGQSSNGGDVQQSGSNNQQADDGGVVVGRDLVQQFTQEARGRTRAEVEEIAKRYAGVSPKSGEPAPFLVVDAPRHLWVRSSGAVGGQHIGAVFNESTVWADCLDTTGFDPDQTDRFGDVWLRIRWHTDKPNNDIASSQPSGRYQGWVYAGQTLPAGHNGKIPQCDGS